ncbi:YggS family pyridoxal phosphate-dependent enzyme [Helicobacter pylori]|uniref:YggS family pyridoxal phosphate-dependent enzyme n=1 Tax=Helicobacter pylori TaxID=210 RepID=UPI001FD04538|nr:YggS family pyridoxal phosphate-dependent enzyme [Helicobacter pylori]UOR41790.1 YggS family pyridoxal phosphate-dependent enzyme [Helicobacter pylori]
MTDYSQRIDTLIAKIEKARIAYSRHHIVKIVAVSKNASLEAIQNYYNYSQRAFGENKVQDLKIKMHSLEHLPLEWHMVGSLQENKINALLSLKPALLHSLDSLKLALKIEKRCEILGVNLNALLQVNSAYEESKSGVMPEETLEIYSQISETCKHLKLKGLMCIGAHADDEKEIEKSFTTTKKLFDRLKNASVLSMGMSDDFELAIACGANLLRIGSFLFKE